MYFFKEPKANAQANHYAIYISDRDATKQYVCDYIDDDSPEAGEINELGLTLRSRILRSNGKYAMLEGTIFNPYRLLDIIVNLNEYDVDRNNGRILLKVTADGCVNQYLIFKERTLTELTDGLEKLKK